MGASLILASSSPYRKQLLQQIGLPFTVCSPSIDESVLPSESPRTLVTRLARGKATAVATSKGGLGAWILAADQVAYCDDSILGKPGTPDRARQMLHNLSGQRVCFITGVCLYAPEGAIKQHLTEVWVRYRKLEGTVIDAYLTKEPEVIHCAAAMRCEGLGISLLDEIQCEGPGALMGLPLLAVCKLLRQAGFSI
ncbi:MAG: Maf family protein [Candidatus Porifericomitaceae bacterium WSBS_2022_MAG_OTU9]